MHKLIVALSLVVSTAALADEGQWMPSQIHELDMTTLRRMGLQLQPDELYKAGDPTSLLHAVVNLSGCSAAFISADGLISTNHHCAYRALQAASSVEHDYLTDGFLAKTREQELEGKGLTVRVLQRIDDVTAEVRKVADAATDDVARAEAVERKEKELLAACEQDGTATCQIAGFYRGSLFLLFTYLELSDVRLVFAPPSAVGNYGGEVDNWMWPRHSGDFTLLRAYAAPGGAPALFDKANQPFKPTRWLKVSADGVTEGSFVSTIGYPGHTDRYLSSAEVARQLEQVFPTLIDVYGEWMAMQEALGKQSDTLRLKVAGRLRGLANRHKNARGMVDGITRMKLLERRQGEDATLAEAATQAGGDDAKVPDALKALSDERRASFEKEFLLHTLLRGPDSVTLAVKLVRWARERQKQDLERAPGYQDRDKDRMWSHLERNLGTFHPTVDEKLLSSWLLRAKAAGIDLGKTDAAKLAKGTRLMDEKKARALFDAADADALASDRDPALVLAHKLVPLYETLEATDRERTGRELVYGPRYFKLLKQVRSGPVYPDANGTLRFSYASVQGYSPRDGIWATPQTTLAGQVAKHTGEDPFDLPQAVRDAAPSAADTYWADPTLGDVPVCFLSTSDTTGGNSGSPVVNGRGELVGFNFDRVWENIAGDFGYNQGHSRNITVDVRYLLWLLDKVVDAPHLLHEVGLASYVGRPRRPAPMKTHASAAAASDKVGMGPTSSTSKGCEQVGASSSLWWLSLGLLLTWRRRAVSR
jgi:hypothetical protein